MPEFKQLHVQEVRLNLYWGGALRGGVARPANATNPADPAYDWALYDRTVSYASAVRHARALLDLRDAELGERRARRRTRADARDRPAQLRARGGEALRRQFPDGQGGFLPPVQRVARLERAEQPALPGAAVRRRRTGRSRARSTTRRSAMPSTRRPRDAVRQRARRLRRHRPRGQQQSEERAAVGITARVPARRQEGRAEELRRLGAPPVLLGADATRRRRSRSEPRRARRPPPSRSATSAI